MGSPRTQPARSTDPVQVDAKHYRVEHEDDRVRILRVRYAPRERSVMHSHPATVAVFLTDYHVRFTYPDGSTEEARGSAGEVRPMEAFDHLPENLTDKSMEVVLVELKR